MISPAKQNTLPRFRVLFVCIGNSCRSPMAEAIANKDAAEWIEISSAGLSPLGVVQKETLQTIELNGYPVEGLYSKPILADDWAKADLVVNMSGYNKESAFPRSEWPKVEDWDIADPYGCNSAVYQRIFDDIRSRIRELIARLHETRW
jgi:arsenate reductase (thioredoxin)